MASAIRNTEATNFNEIIMTFYHLMNLKQLAPECTIVNLIVHDLMEHGKKA